ncbi:MAG: MBL fold metallo-hydrolase [Myxococcales bacterium]|nr:MBL fold metallo-hydrolase [Myxococcales bacterium]
MRRASTIGVVFLFGLVGCATTHGVRRVGELEVHTFRRDWANAHAVVGPGGAFLFDAGLERNAEALDQDLRAAGLDPGSLRAVILSHGHADHAGGARVFRERYGTPIVAARADGPMLRAGHNDPLCPTDDDARGRVEEDGAETFQPFEPDVWVDASVELGPLTGVHGRIVPLPGHTPGSLVVVLDEVALVGDLFRGTVFTEGASVHFYMCDLEDNHADVRELLDALAPSAHTFFPGHFGPLARGAVEDAFPARGAR